MSEESILDGLKVDNVRAHVEHIVSKIPTRLAGSENGKRMAEYSRDALRQAGVRADVHTLPGLVSFPEPADCRVTAPVEMSIAAHTLGHSLQTPPEGIGGELVYVGSGGFDDYQGKDALGKITLSELSYSPARHEKQRIAALEGATGAIMMNWGHPENNAVPFGSVKPVWGNPTPENYHTEMPTIPCIGIGRSDGLRLKEMCEGAERVEVRFQTDVENGWRPVQITVGEIPAPGGEDFVVVGGHQDSWFGEAATDNAAGNACVMELARVFNQHRDELRRGLVFGFWTGHETGTMIGSSWFVDRNWDRLRDHQVAYLQIDQPACAGTTEWGTMSNVELRRFLDTIARHHLGNRKSEWQRAVKTGDNSFFGLGVPMVHGEGRFTAEELQASALATLGWWHHTLDNTIDKLDWVWMADHLRIYGAWLWELCTAPVLPFEFVGVSEQFAERLAELSAAGESIDLDGVLHRAKQFGEAAARLDQTADRWRQHYRKGGAVDESAAEVLNGCMKRLSRLLVPIQSTIKGTYGHDPYGLTAQATMIPALYEAPRLAQLPPDSEDRWMLETLLVRQRNRVADALGDASSLIEESLRQLS